MIDNGIYGINFRNFSDNIGPDLYDPHKTFIDIEKDIQTIYCGIEFCHQTFDYINRNSHQKFILVTHNSDNNAEERDLPNNLLHWYTQNLNFRHDKVSPLPIGFENPFWHPWKETFFNNPKYYKERIFKPFAQFNPVTHEQERMKLIDLIHNKTIDADQYYCKNGENFSLYVDNMRKYQFCLCPRGNGLDTHRLWESIYFGCIPIVKRHITHVFEYSLPIIFVNDWSELTDKYLHDEYNKINFDDFNSPVLSMQYWKEKIYS